MTRLCDINNAVVSWCFLFNVKGHQKRSSMARRILHGVAKMDTVWCRQNCSLVELWNSRDTCWFNYATVIDHMRWTLENSNIVIGHNSIVISLETAPRLIHYQPCSLIWQHFHLVMYIIGQGPTNIPTGAGYLAYLVDWYVPGMCPCDISGSSDWDEPLAFKSVFCFDRFMCIFTWCSNNLNEELKNVWWFVLINLSTWGWKFCFGKGTVQVYHENRLYVNIDFMYVKIPHYMYILKQVVCGSFMSSSL